MSDPVWVEKDGTLKIRGGDMEPGRLYEIKWGGARTGVMIDGDGSISVYEYGEGKS